MNWYERIQAAKVTGKFAYDDYYVAGNWATCAVGERIGNMVNISMNDPRRCGLITLGCSFAAAIVQNNVEQVEQLYNKIQVCCEMNEEVCV